jgi:hypothetical protein
VRPILPFPQELRPQLPTVVGNVDYQTLRQRLEQIDALLYQSGLEADFVRRALAQWRGEGSAEPTVEQQLKVQQRARRALRCNVLRTLLQEGYRRFSYQLAANVLYQRFCLIDGLDQIRVPSKSELQRFAHLLPAEEMREVFDGLLRTALGKPRKLRLKEPLDLEAYFLDSTCLKANIHFPTDWVLLRDAVRTLMRATLLIRRAGLRARMRSPEECLKEVNRRSIQMSQQTRRSGSQRGRKRVLRQLKLLVDAVRAHAQRHRDLLDRRWEQTAYTRGQVQQILRRVDGVVALLPRAKKQAHERIIGGRKVANQEKILSLYDPEVRVIVRGKAGAEVEFGNTALFGENRQGVILDYAIYRESAPADVHLLFESLLRVGEGIGASVGGVVTDRGFYSASNSRTLREGNTFDGLCPRNPTLLRQRMKEEKFARLQRRRAQTEARIGILKAGFLGRPMRAKGFAHRELALAWGVLTHNLWMLARLKKTKKKASPLRIAA